MIQILIDCLLTLEPPGGDDTDIDWLSPHLGASRWWWYRYWLIIPSPWSLQVVMIKILIDYLLTLEPPGGDDTYTDWLSPHLGASRWWWYRYWLVSSAMCFASSALLGPALKEVPSGRLPTGGPKMPPSMKGKFIEDRWRRGEGGEGRGLEGGEEEYGECGSKEWVEDILHQSGWYQDKSDGYCMVWRTGLCHKTAICINVCCWIVVYKLNSIGLKFKSIQNKDRMSDKIFIFGDYLFVHCK
jgi:hypothetical protein